MITVFIASQIILISYSIYQYNKLNILRERAIEALTNIDIQLDKKTTIVIGLSKIVKAYDAHEAELLYVVATARHVSSSTELKNIIARIESNPQIKSANLYLENQRHLVVVEGDIQAARVIYNAAATRYNELRSVIPVIIVANSFGFSKAMLFEQAPL